ncbi:MAG: IS200/IS605 family accessory protein TnpB-related protein, partial [Microcoleaceae cyanobacterium]
MNRWYNKQISTIKENQPQGFWSNKLAAITEKRDCFPAECGANVPRNQMRDGINKAARIVINHCLAWQLGTIVFGWNKGQKNQIELGKKSNSEFVPIPTARLKERIAQLCDEYGIIFILTEESYTSIASFLDGDHLPIYGEKLGAGARNLSPSKEAPTLGANDWKPSGKRIKRCSAVLGRQRGLGEAARSWGGSAVLG